MKTPIDAAKAIFAVWLIAGFLSPAVAAESRSTIDPPRIPAPGAPAQSGNCKITVLKTYVWRDWMPIVARPGPDRGSPLRARVNLILDNSAGDANRFSFRAAVVDEQGQCHPVPFRIRPNLRALPGGVGKSYRASDGETRKGLPAGHDAAWEGELNPGEIREVELTTAEGPYLPVGSRVHVRIEWTDKKGNTVLVRTPDVPIQRTD